MGSDNLFHKRRKEREINRKNKQNSRVGRRILIVVEGETEDIYFKSLIDYHKLSNVEVSQCSLGTSHRNIVTETKQKLKEAKREGVGFTHAFCVFDLDVDTKNAIETAKNIHLKKMSDAILYAVVSYPCIEFWFLLHFVYTSQSFSPCGNKTIGQSVKSHLKSHWVEYHKTIQHTYGMLKNHAEQMNQDVHENARRLLLEQQQCQTINPITNAHKLVAYLETNLEETLRSFDHEFFYQHRSM